MKDRLILLVLIVGLGFLTFIECSYISLNKEKEDIKHALESFKKTTNIYKEKQFKGETLTFLTPWQNYFVKKRNKSGHQRALKFYKKIDYISPVWFEIKEISDSLKLTGEHDIDEEFLKEVNKINTENNMKIKVIPRIYIQEEKVIVLLNDMWNRDLIVDQIMKLLPKFDGFVFDSVFLSYLSVAKQYDQMSFIRQLSTNIREKNNKLLFASISLITQFYYVNYQGKQERYHWKMNYMMVLMDQIDKLLVSTYDYHQIVDGLYPISPISWVKENISFFDQKYKSKLIIGMPFYGFKIEQRVDYLMGEELHKLIESNDVNKVAWDEKSKECVFASSTSNLRYFYPCLKFIDERLRLFESEKIGGVFIWELGQGQDILLEPF